MEKPKVRFSHNSENAAELAIPKKVNHLQEKGKVKVKSIVPINLPVKVLKNGKRLLLKDQANTNDVQVVSEQNVNKKSNNQYANNRKDFNSYTNDNCKEMNSGQDVESRAEQRSETEISETPANYIHINNEECNQRNKIDLDVQTCTDELQEVTIDKTDKGFSKASAMKKNQMLKKMCNPNFIAPTEKSIPCIHLDGSDDDEEVKEVEIVKNFDACHFQQRSKNKSRFDSQVPTITLTPEQEDKENDDGYSDFHRPFHKIKATANNDILKDATSSLCNKNKNINKKPAKVQRKLQVMPCAKFKVASSGYKKHSDKRTTVSHTKTRPVFNIAGRASNVLVQPEMSDRLHSEHSKCNLKKSYERKDIASKNLLSQPEYNSAVCVMKKLREIEGEKLISDVETLPAAYRNLVHGKVSAALDFGPYESVYKNLINLSVDDAELPTRLTRTKDPEPRNKDVTPSLSQFYNPKNTREHFTSLDPKIFNPISVDTLNAFTISNKICAWRISRDSF